MPAQIQPMETQFIFIRLTVLREYLYRELCIPGLPFKEDIEVRSNLYILIDYQFNFPVCFTFNLLF